MSYDIPRYLDVLTQAAEELRIDPRLIHISHGGAALLFKIKEETSDIDVTIPTLEFDSLIANGTFVKDKIIDRPALGQETATVSYIYVNQDGSGEVDFHRARDNDLTKKYFELENGMQVTSKIQTLIDYLKLGRDKDIETIEYLYGNIITPAKLKEMYDLEVLSMDDIAWIFSRYHELTVGVARKIERALTAAIMAVAACSKADEAKHMSLEETARLKQKVEQAVRSRPHMQLHNRPKE